MEDAFPKKRSRSEGSFEDASNHLGAYLLDLKCIICLKPCYHFLAMVCPDNKACRKGGHVMCPRCLEGYKNMRCPLCQAYAPEYTWKPFIASGMMDSLKTTLDGLKVVCKTCGKDFEGRQAYLSHFSCEICGLEKTGCTDPPHSCVEAVQAKLGELEAYWKEKLDKETTALQKTINCRNTTISDLRETLQENGIDADSD